MFNRPKNVNFHKCNSARENHWKIVNKSDPFIKKGRMRYYIREVPNAIAYLINWHDKGEKKLKNIRLNIRTGRGGGS